MYYTTSSKDKTSRRLQRRQKDKSRSFMKMQGLGSARKKCLTQIALDLIFTCLNDVHMCEHTSLCRYTGMWGGGRP